MMVAKFTLCQYYYSNPFGWVTEALNGKRERTNDDDDDRVHHNGKSTRRMNEYGLDVGVGASVGYILCMCVWPYYTSVLQMRRWNHSFPFK